MIQQLEAIYLLDFVDFLKKYQKIYKFSTSLFNRKTDTPHSLLDNHLYTNFM